jgi:hypothetical protein
MLSFYVMMFMCLTKNFTQWNEEHPGKHPFVDGLYSSVVILFPFIGLPMARFYIIRRGRFNNKAIQSFADIIEEPPSFFFQDLKDAFTVWKNEPLIQMYFYPITGVKNNIEMLSLKRQKERLISREFQKNASLPPMISS